MLAPKESFRAAAALYTALALVTVGLEILPGRSLLAAFCSAEVKFEACCPGGETDVWRVERSNGVVWLLIVYISDERTMGEKSRDVVGCLPR